MRNINSITSDNCCGCSACNDKCPVSAISMSENAGDRMPMVDEEKCIFCGQCLKVCPNYSVVPKSKYEKKSYVAFYKEKNVEEKSSSGGIFAALACYILGNGGIVYGASIKREDGSVVCRHIRIDKIDDLHLVQGSKYVQSLTDGIFKQVLQDLKTNKTVLFSGTSCQVASLKRYVGDRDNLYTVDLVCHGVPKYSLFNDYIEYLQKKWHGNILNISFREKGRIYHEKILDKILSISIKNENGMLQKKEIIQPHSSFYCLFINRAGYRNSCYNCKYASPDKPADLTLGDFSPTHNEINTYSLLTNKHYSSVIVHSEHGMQLLREIKNSIFIKEIPFNEMIRHHGNLNHPSAITEEGEHLYNIYLKGGFEKLHSYIEYENIKSNFKWQVYKYLKLLKL